MHLQNRTFIISGGSSGLALATARLLHSHGAYISLLDMNAEAGDAIISELGSVRARFHEVDVTDTDSIAAAVQGTVEWVQTTGAALGGVVAGAGVGNPGLIIDKNNEPLPLAAFDFVINVNLRGTIDLIRQTLPYLTQNEPLGADGERGVLLMFASSAAFDGQMGQVAYAASKGGLASLTLPLARDLSRFGIRAVTIAPSLFESGMTAMMGAKVRQSLERVMEWPKRAGKPDEFARVARECIENPMLNGTVIRLDGAMRMPSKL
ncbi:3-hydroxyacyl-CoA dehydrogenase type-2 [Pseudovirgaria hyperparasitica]|uniref:3-hydroxyacyl-CoA dehydrogenase type-2 n=1 Tax=Pseudovirgaria hyperparasitica TaxID=470096 RepID=A0A6A6VSC4_9PEZI|nr:3-hydroxyacyl-CoA dehydrogenase type-2 [Pseudovirgaria hyperparasitica]KAF2753123.1 3-hydroxyacyl-CoA dehydrogenase type-2 [Pseudovirgaria hyperparasitica]